MKNIKITNYTKGYTRFERKNGVGEKPAIDFKNLE